MGITILRTITVFQQHGKIKSRKPKRRFSIELLYWNSDIVGRKEKSVLSSSVSDPDSLMPDPVKVQFTYHQASIKDIQATGEPCSPQKRTSSTSKHEFFSIFEGLIALPDPDLGPLT